MRPPRRSSPSTTRRCAASSSPTPDSCRRHPASLRRTKDGVQDCSDVNVGASMARYLRRRRAARQQPSTPAAAAADPASAPPASAAAAAPPAGKGEVAAQVNERYSTAAPSAQNQLDLFKGAWTSAVPVPGEVTASGPRADLFDDGRIAWAIERLGPLAGKRVLELGPLEAGHTMMLERAGAQVLAIEAHSGAFLRCLVVKNLLDLRARFLFGDFLPYLRKAEEHFDAVVASGVLYHMTRPVELLHLLASHTDRLFVWTHYWHGGLAEERPDVPVVGPHEQPVRVAGEEVQQLDRTRHVIEHAARDHGVEVLLGLAQIGQEVTEQEAGAQVEPSLEHEAAQERPRMRLDGQDLGAGTLQHHGVAGLQGSKLQHALAGQGTEALDRPGDAPVVEQIRARPARRHLPGHGDGGGPRALEQVELVLRRRRGGGVALVHLGRHLALPGGRRGSGSRRGRCRGGICCRGSRRARLLASRASAAEVPGHACSYVDVAAVLHAVLRPPQAGRMAATRVGCGRR